MLKAQLHIHTKEDPQDKISYTAKELIDEAAKQNFDVISFTCHNKVIHNFELEQYAKEKGILLIPGVERTIEGKHVLLYDLTEEESRQITSFQKLNQFKIERQKQNRSFLIMAAHPFHIGSSCLKSKAIKHLDLFDAWEFSFFYLDSLRLNKKTVRLARKYGKPIVGSSDVHRLGMLGQTYSFIDSEKNLDSVFRAIKNNQTKIKTKPLSFFSFSIIFAWVILSTIKQLTGQKPT